MDRKEYLSVIEEVKAKLKVGTFDVAKQSKPKLLDYIRQSGALDVFRKAFSARRQKSTFASIVKKHLKGDKTLPPTFASLRKLNVKGLQEWITSLWKKLSLVGNHKKYKTERLAKIVKSGKLLAVLDREAPEEAPRRPLAKEPRRFGDKRRSGPQKKEEPQQKGTLPFRSGGVGAQNSAFDLIRSGKASDLANLQTQLNLDRLRNQFRAEELERRATQSQRLDLVRAQLEQQIRDLQAQKEDAGVADIDRDIRRRQLEDQRALLDATMEERRDHQEQIQMLSRQIDEVNKQAEKDRAELAERTAQIENQVNAEQREAIAASMRMLQETQRKISEDQARTDASAAELKLFMQTSQAKFDMELDKERRRTEKNLDRFERKQKENKAYVDAENSKRDVQHQLSMASVKREGDAINQRQTLRLQQLEQTAKIHKEEFDREMRNETRVQRQEEAMARAKEKSLQAQFDALKVRVEGQLLERTRTLREENAILNEQKASAASQEAIAKSLTAISQSVADRKNIEELAKISVTMAQNKLKGEGEALKQQVELNRQQRQNYERDTQRRDQEFAEKMKTLAADFAEKERQRQRDHQKFADSMVDAERKRVEDAQRFQNEMQKVQRDAAIQMADFFVKQQAAYIKDKDARQDLLAKTQRVKDEISKGSVTRAMNEVMAEMLRPVDEMDIDAGTGMPALERTDREELGRMRLEFEKNKIRASNQQELAKLKEATAKIEKANREMKLDPEVVQENKRLKEENATLREEVKTLRDIAENDPRLDPGMLSVQQQKPVSIVPDEATRKRFAAFQDPQAKERGVASVGVGTGSVAPRLVQEQQPAISILPGQGPEMEVDEEEEARKRQQAEAAARAARQGDPDQKEDEGPPGGSPGPAPGPPSLEQGGGDAEPQGGARDGSGGREDEKQDPSPDAGDAPAPADAGQQDAGDKAEGSPKRIKTEPVSPVRPPKKRSDDPFADVGLKPEPNVADEPFVLDFDVPDMTAGPAAPQRQFAAKIPAKPRDYQGEEISIQNAEWSEDNTGPDSWTNLAKKLDTLRKEKPGPLAKIPHESLTAVVENELVDVITDKLADAWAGYNMGNDSSLYVSALNNLRGDINETFRAGLGEDQLKKAFAKARKRVKSLDDAVKYLGTTAAIGGQRRRKVRGKSEKETPVDDRELQNLRRFYGAEVRFDTAGQARKRRRPARPQQRGRFQPASGLKAGSFSIPKKFHPDDHTDDQLREKVSKLDKKASDRLHRQVLRDVKRRSGHEGLQRLQTIVHEHIKKSQQRRKHGLKSRFLSMQSK